MEWILSLEMRQVQGIQEVGDTRGQMEKAARLMKLKILCKMGIASALKQVLLN